MHEHRLAFSDSIEFHPFTTDFSSFHFLTEKELISNPAIHRCFSLARSVSSSKKSIIWEQLSPQGCGIINEENIALKKTFPDYECTELFRVSFWKQEVNNINNIDVLSSQDLIGYLIIKHDICPTLSVNRSHVFEAVFAKYNHPHNCSNGAKDYKVRIGSKCFTAHGVIFCQQNSIFKCCAHVALFSILSLFETDKEISFAEMNKVAGIIPPNTGLSLEAVRKILRHYGVDFYDIDYDEARKSDKDMPNGIPVQRLA